MNEILTYSDDDVLSIKASQKTPYVFFAADGQFSIRGISIPEDGPSFFESIFGWLHNYIKKPNDKTVLSIEMEYINEISMRCLLGIIKQLDTSCNQFHVEWSYSESDDDLRDLGEILASSSKACFKFNSI